MLLCNITIIFQKLLLYYENSLYIICLNICFDHYNVAEPLILSILAPIVVFRKAPDRRTKAGTV